MKLEIYSIYDQKANVYGRPFFSLNRDIAIRNCLVASSDPDSELSRFPEDFVLFFLGFYDDATGVISGDDPVSVSRINALSNKEE